MKSRLRTMILSRGLQAVALVLALGAALPALALEVGAQAPEIGLVGVDGKTIRISELRGKVVVVDFWASWCAPCRESFPFLERLHRRYASRGLAVIGVSVDSQDAEFRSFLSAHPATFAVARDASREVARRYAPPAMPTSFLIDRSGVVRHVQLGYRHRLDADVERRVVALLDQPAP